jgi:hypothetical protein
MTSLLLIFETRVVLSNFILCFHISLGSWQQDSWVILCRAANVFSCAYLVNLVRPAHRKIPSKHQKALWYSGKEAISTSHWLYRVKLISSANERNCFFPLAFSLLWRLSFFCSVNMNRTSRGNGLCPCSAISSWSSRRTWTDHIHCNYSNSCFDGKNILVVL